MFGRSPAASRLDDVPQDGEVFSVLGHVPRQPQIQENAFPVRHLGEQFLGIGIRRNERQAALGEASGVLHGNIPNSTDSAASRSASADRLNRSDEHTSEPQSLMRNS